MADPITLPDRNSEPDASTVEVLENALAEAKSGRLRSVVLVGNMTGNVTFTDYSTTDAQEAIGLTSLMNFRMCALQNGP